MSERERNSKSEKEREITSYKKRNSKKEGGIHHTHTHTHNYNSLSSLIFFLSFYCGSGKTYILPPQPGLNMNVMIFTFIEQ